ncbi:MAG TPA: hypothetical protein VHX42_00525 [Candidatus Babeliales bacterium]|jgi:hypothetical protein|nr:hypothetical protein [Candidatus Babeliales bacterium]
MKFFKSMLLIITIFTIGSLIPMEPQFNSYPPKRPTAPAPQRSLTSSPQRPSVPAPQRPLNSTPTYPIPQNQQVNTNSAEKALPAIPSPQNQIELTPQSSTPQNRRSNNVATKKALPTPPSLQNTIKPTSQPSRYAEMLEIITGMDSENILVHNRFTNQFINFIQSQHLSHEDIAALSEAIATLYMTSTSNKEKDEQILLSLKNSITPHLPLQIIEKKEPHIQKQTDIKEQHAKKSFEKTSSPQKHFTTHNLIMLLDPEKTETINGTARMLVQDALVALYEQAAPIIMSSNILEIITTLRDILGEDILKKLRNSTYNKLTSSIQQILTSFTLHESPLHLMILSLIDFDSKNFNCYFHTSEDLVLIIPQQYIIKNIKEGVSQFNFQDQAKKCGFNPDVTTPINNLSSDNLLAQFKIQHANVKHTDQFIKNLTSFFIPQKNDGKLITPTETIPWIIYLAGHGGTLYQSIGSIREQLEIHKNNLVFYEKALQNNKKNHVVTQNIIFAETNIKKYEKILQGKSDWPDSQLVIGKANIAGLTMDNFPSLMAFFDQKLDVYYVHYASCFDGGYKQTFVNEILTSLDVNFITSTQGLDERETTGIHLDLSFNSKAPYITVSKRPFSAFFKVLNIFIGQPEKFVQAKKYQKEPFSYVLSSIVSDMDHYNQPFIRFPGVGIFGALSLSKKTRTITNVMSKAHEIENKPIDLSDTEIDIVIVIPSHINIPLNFGKNRHCAIISPTPAIMRTSHEAIHIFKEINFENPLQALIFNFISFNARIHTQTFIIKQLTGISIQQSLNNIINNLIIHIQHIPGPTIRARLKIAFEFKENIYECETEINNFEDPHLAHFIYSLGFIPTTDVTALAYKFLTPQEINTLKQPITLESIIQLIDAKIDVQQPSLKGTAVKKELTEFVKEMPKGKKRIGK